MALLSDDCRYRLCRGRGINSPTEEQIHQLALYDIRKILERQGHTMTEYGLPEPVMENLHPSREEEARQAQEKRREEAVQEWNTNRDKIQVNEDQANAFEQIRHAIDTGGGGMFYLDGPGGSGKTFVERLCLSYVWSKNLEAAAVASTGIAALLLPEGKTAHFQFKIPLDLKPDMVCGITLQSPQGQWLRQVAFLVWDEIIMQHNKQVDAVDRLFRDAKGCNRPFGGITVLFAGGSRVQESHTNGQETFVNVYRWLQKVLRRTKWTQQCSCYRYGRRYNVCSYAQICVYDHKDKKKRPTLRSGF